MTEQENTVHKKAASFKNITAIIVIILLISGGIALAFVSTSNQTTKEKFFDAEKKSIDSYFAMFENRYQTELEWLDYAQENPIETDFGFSLKYDARFVDDDLGLGLNFNDILDNTQLTVTTQRDAKAKQLATDLELNLSGLKIDDFNFYLTDDAVMLGLPFLDEVLKYRFSDMGNLVGEDNPALAEENIKQFFNTFFNQNDSLLTKADRDYFKEEYFDSFYDAISEDDFTTSEDKIEVNNKSIKAEKVVLDLDEASVKDILITMLNRLKSEERLQEIIEKQVPSIALTEANWKEFTTEFKEGIEMLKSGVGAFHIPDGLTSTLWLDDDHIIQREFDMTLGPNPNELITLSLHGQQLFKSEQQFFNYTLSAEDEFENYDMVISGDLFWDDKKLDDEIQLEVEDINLTYKADETINNKERDFNRKFSFTDNNDQVSLDWSGSSAYENDKMTSEHLFSVDDPDSDETIGLQVDIDSKRIKSVDIPTDNINDLGEMSETELNNFFDNEVEDRFEEWLIRLIGFPGGF